MTPSLSIDPRRALDCTTLPLEKSASYFHSGVVIRLTIDRWAELMRYISGRGGNRTQSGKTIGRFIYVKKS